MAKKKKGKKKKGKAKGSSGTPGEMGTTEKVVFLESQKHAIERELAVQRAEARSAAAEKLRLQNSVNDMTKQFDEEQKNTFDITRNMTRQYKCMQENLLKQITEAHQTINQLKGELDKSHQAVKDTQEEMRKAVDDKDRVIQDLNKRMEEMASEFGEMLKETLEKMRDRIEVTNTQYSQKDNGARILRNLEASRDGGQ